MIQAEVAAILRRAQELFPSQVTGEQAALLSRRIAHLDYRICNGALDDHRMVDEWWSLPRFIRCVDASRLRIQRAVARSNAAPVWEWIRDNGGSGPDPIDYVRNHYRACAAAVRENADATDHGREQAIQMIVGHCRMALVEIGFDNADAKDIATAAVRHSCAVNAAGSDLR